MAPANFVWRKFEWECQGDRYRLEITSEGDQARLTTLSANESSERQLLVLSMTAWAAISDAIGQTQIQERRAGMPARAGKFWTPGEEEKVIKAFREDVPVEQIAKQHDRTPGGIIARLEKAGLVEPGAVAPPPPVATNGVPQQVNALNRH